MTSFAGVRLARPEDEDAIFQLLVPMWAENALPGFALSERKAREEIAKGTRGRGNIVGVIDGDGLEACAGFGIAEMWYSEAPYLLELWSYVRPDRRASTHAKRLIEFGKWASDELSRSGTNVPLMFGTISLHRLLPKARLYQRHGPQVGIAFMHGLKGESADFFAQRSEKDMPAFRAKEVA